MGVGGGAVHTDGPGDNGGGEGVEGGPGDGLVAGMVARGRLYILLNIIGSGLSCYASVLIRYWPFVVLEGCWVLELRQSCVPRLELRPNIGLAGKKTVTVE